LLSKSTIGLGALATHRERGGVALRGPRLAASSQGHSCAVQAGVPAAGRLAHRRPGVRAKWGHSYVLNLTCWWADCARVRLADQACRSKRESRWG
jgi:hypothetical protein